MARGVEQPGLSVFRGSSAGKMTLARALPPSIISFSDFLLFGLQLPIKRNDPQPGLDVTNVEDVMSAGASTA